jgi:ornithine cyclodeaminase/alanine dehydrogenase-like protein (mu-crystallin family)
MALLLSEDQVHQVLAGMTSAKVAADVTACIERAFLEQQKGKARLHQRIHIDYPKGRGYLDGTVIRILPGMLPELGGAGFRAYADHHGHGQVLDADRGRQVIDYMLASELLILYDYKNNMKLQAIISGSFLNVPRTAAATSLSVRHLARKNSKILGFFGAGRHAYFHIRCVLNERPDLREIRLCNRTPARRDALAERLRGEVSQTIVTVDNPKDAVADCDIVVTCTNAGKPVFDGEWLAPGTHITQVARDEIDATTVRRSRLFPVWKDQILHDTPVMGPYGPLVASGELNEANVTDLCEVIAGTAPGRRTEEEITLCASQGMGIWDVAIAQYIYGLAKQKGIGTEFEFHANVPGYAQ